MGDFNYCFIGTNKIYADIQDMLDLEDISMNNPNHYSKVIYHLEKLVSKAKYIQIKPAYKDKDEFKEQLFVDITEKIKEKEGFQGNTLMLSASTLGSYEVIYFEDLLKKQTEENLNELVTISNLEMEPIFNDCAIVKISYDSGEHVHQRINIDDIQKIVKNCFYHTGVLISEDGSLKELDFPGDNVSLIIGNTFKMGTPFFLAGLQIVPYIEESKKPNKKASDIMDSEINGRLFLAVLSPMGGKKFWNMDIETINCLLKLSKDQEKLKKIDQEIDEKNKAVNPFFLIKKYCIL